MLLFNRLFQTMRKPFSILFMIMIVTLAFQYIDKPLAEYVSAFDFRHHFHLLSWFSGLGLGIVYLCFFFIAALFFRTIRVNKVWEARCWFLWISLVCTNSVCIFLKMVLGRARPDMWFEKQYYGFYGLQKEAAFWSFPSGHTTTIMTLAFGFSVLFPRQSMIYMSLGLLVALSRVLLGYHYFTDILTASYLVLIEMGCLLWILKKNTWLTQAFNRDEL